MIEKKMLLVEAKLDSLYKVLEMTHRKVDEILQRLKLDDNAEGLDEPKPMYQYVLQRDHVYFHSWDKKNEHANWVREISHAKRFDSSEDAECVMEDIEVDANIVKVLAK